MPRLATLLAPLLDFIYPPACPVCDAFHETDGVLCPACLGQLAQLEAQTFCPRCAMPLGQPGPCPHCRGKGMFPFGRAAALATFRPPMKPLIHHLKYHRRWPLGELLAERMLACPRVAEVLAETDVLVAVPLYRWRQYSRGYNQSEVIARRLAKGVKVKVARPLIRVRNTESQTRFAQSDREANMRDAFALVDEKGVHGRRVTLVDDVMTTGATLRSAARALRLGKSAALNALVVARADPLGRDFQAI